MAGEARIDSGTARAFTLPTDAPEADGTMAWNATTLIVVELRAAGLEGTFLDVLPKGREEYVNNLVDWAKIYTSEAGTKNDAACGCAAG